MQSLEYKVENAQLVTIQQVVDYEGTRAIISYERTVIECLPANGVGQTISMTLPAEALDEFPEGLAVTISIAASEVVAAEEGA